MNSQRITKNYYPPVPDDTKKGYLVRIAEEIEAAQEIKDYGNESRREYTTDSEEPRSTKM